MKWKAAVLTVSDRSARGERPDEGGPLVRALLEQAGYSIVKTAVVPDEQDEIADVLRRWADEGSVQLLLTTGGTGFTPRDVTPEATLSVCTRLTPGIPEAMRAASMAVTNRAMLSRAGHPGPDFDREPAGKSQGRAGKSGGRPPRAEPRAGDALRRTGGLRRPAELSRSSRLPKLKTSPDAMRVRGRSFCFQKRRPSRWA